MIYILEIPAKDEIDHLSSKELVETYRCAASGQNSEDALNYLIATLNGEEVDTENNFLTLIEYTE